MPAAVKLRALASMPAPLPARDVDLLATAVLLLDAGERIVHVNPAAENLFELSRQKFLGHALADVFEPASALAVAIERARASGASVCAGRRLATATRVPAPAGAAISKSSISSRTPIRPRPRPVADVYSPRRIWSRFGIPGPSSTTTTISFSAEQLIRTSPLPA